MSSQFFVILDYPYEGSLVIPYEVMGKAQLEYRDGLARLQKGQIQGVAVIYGQVVRATGSLANLKPIQQEEEEPDIKPVNPRKNLPRDLLDPFPDHKEREERKK